MTALWPWWTSWAAAAEPAAHFVETGTGWLPRVGSFLGIFAFIAMSWAISENRSRIAWRPVIWGVGLQLLLGLVLLSPTVSEFFYVVVDGGVRKLLNFSEQGATFVFATMDAHTINTGEPAELFAGGGKEVVYIGTVSPPVKTFAFWILPTIVFFSSLMSVLYHVGVMQLIVKAIAWLMVRTLGTSGAESLSAAANIFVGQTEAPLLVRPFIDKMTRSELAAVMVGGFATVSGGVLGAYVSFLRGIPSIAGHLVMASIMSAPAALAVAKILVPETEESVTRGTVTMTFEKPATNLIEAAGQGATDGVKLALNVAGMLIAIVALVAMFDWLLGLTPITFCDGGGVAAGYQCTGPGHPLSLSLVLGWLCAPLALAMGVPWAECGVVGGLLGEKIVLTEFIAYIHLGDVVHAEPGRISARSAVITSYALCGFANFASIGIQLGGLGGMAPRRVPDLASLGMRTMIGGVIASCMTGCIAGIMLA